MGGCTQILKMKILGYLSEYKYSLTSYIAIDILRCGVMNTSKKSSTSYQKQKEIELDLNIAKGVSLETSGRTTFVLTENF